MNVKLTSHFKRKINLPDYLIGGFSYCLTDGGGILDSNGEIGNIDNVELSQLSSCSDIFRCSFMDLEDGLNLSIVFKDADTRYLCILVLYVDLMQNDVLGLNSFNNYSKIAAVITASYPYKNLFEEGEFNGELKHDKHIEIPNIIPILPSYKCSILSRNYDDESIYHIKDTQIASNEYTNPTTGIDNTLLKYKPTKDLLMDDIISRDQNHDSFMISKSGLIKI